MDSLLYVDTDILFLQPVENIYALLSHFNTNHLAAMAPEHEEPRIGWYNRFARHPYYGKTGINSGVMLMNMTRIRKKFFEVKVLKLRENHNLLFLVSAGCVSFYRAKLTASCYGSLSTSKIKYMLVGFKLA